MALSPLEPWIFSPHWRDNWSSLAKQRFDQFGKSADELLGNLHTVKDALQKIAVAV